MLITFDCALSQTLGRWPRSNCSVVQVTDGTHVCLRLTDSPPTIRHEPSKLSLPEKCHSDGTRCVVFLLSSSSPTKGHWLAYLAQ
jgi:hypothetical protein